MKPILKTPSLNPSLLPNIYLLPPSSTGRWGNGGQFITCYFDYCSGRGVLALLQPGILPTGYSPFINCSNVGPFPRGKVLQRKPVQKGLQKGHNSYQEAFSTMDSSLHRSSGPFQEPTTAWASHRFTAPLWAGPTLAQVSSTG